ncbi:hypothetical protein LINPERPRIM_LOCUS8974 [Linum perenne]
MSPKVTLLSMLVRIGVAADSSSELRS